MACSFCSKNIGRSYSKKPFTPPSGNINELTFICECGQRWWQHNRGLRLWSHIDDDATWKNILKGCPEPVEIGNPSVNLN